MKIREELVKALGGTLDTFRAVRIEHGISAPESLVPCAAAVLHLVTAINLREESGDWSGFSPEDSDEEEGS